MDNIYKNIEDCIPNKKRQILIFFDDIVADICKYIYKNIWRKSFERFLNEIKDEGKNINEQTFNEFYDYHYPSFLVKDRWKKSK